MLFFGSTKITKTFGVEDLSFSLRRFFKHRVQLQRRLIKFANMSKLADAILGIAFWILIVRIFTLFCNYDFLIVCK